MDFRACLASSGLDGQTPAHPDVSTYLISPAPVKKRMRRKIFYFRETGECDFVVKEKTAIILVIQVCYQVDTRNKEREINGLIEAMDMFGLKEGYILTFSQEDEVHIGDKKIILTPAREFSFVRTP